MIAQRREVEIIFEPVEPTDTSVRCGLSFRGDLSVSPFQIHFGDLMGDSAIIETSSKHFRLWDRKKENLLLWFTVDKLLFDKWRGASYVTGLDDYRKFTSYKLHYVGESADRDTFQRLIDEPHHGRLAVLSNEYQMSPTAAISDEVTLLMFELSNNFVRRLTLEELEDENFDPKRPVLNYPDLIKDAERALIRIVQSKYNNKKYKNYPQGKDTLLSQGVNWHGYVINEDISLQTEAAILVGGYLDDGPCSNDADLICVQDRELVFVKASQLAELDRLRREHDASS